MITFNKPDCVKILLHKPYAGLNTTIITENLEQTVANNFFLNKHQSYSCCSFLKVMSVTKCLSFYPGDYK